MTTITLETDARAVAERRLSAAWDAFDDHRPELGSLLSWDAADTALRQPAGHHGYAIGTPDQRI